MRTKRFLITLFSISPVTKLFSSETQGNSPEDSTLVMVMAVILVIWFGISAYLFIIDRKTKKLESNLADEK